MLLSSVQHQHNNKSLCGAYYVSGTILKNIYVDILLALLIDFRGKYYYYRHFIDEETVAWRERATCPSCSASKWHSQDLNSVSLASVCAFNSNMLTSILLCSNTWPLRVWSLGHDWLFTFLSVYPDWSPSLNFWRYQLFFSSLFFLSPF